MLYLVLLAAVVLGSLVWRGVLRRGADAPVRSLGALTPWEAAFLAGGTQRVIDAGVVALHEQGVLRWDAATRSLVNDDPRRRLEPPLDAIALHASAKGFAALGVRRTAGAIDAVRRRLQQRGLWLEDATARRIAALSALPALLLCAFGAAKIAIGISRDRPVLLLALLCALTAAFALGMFLARPGRSRAGDGELKRLQSTRRGATRTTQPESLAMTVALAGTAVLAGTALGGYHQARAASSSSSDGGSGSDSSSDGGGGGSGCGGCGGGGD